MPKISPRTVKAIVAAVFMAAASALSVYGATASIFYINTPTGVIVSLWDLCFQKDGNLDKSTCRAITKYDCEQQHDSFSSARAFVIITIVLAAVGFWFALLETFKYKTTKWRVTFSLMTFVSGVISWAIVLSFFTTQQCELFGSALTDFANARIGGAFPALFVAWILVIAALAVEFVDSRKWFECFYTRKNSEDEDGGKRKRRPRSNSQRRRRHKRRTSSNHQ